MLQDASRNLLPLVVRRVRVQCPEPSSRSAETPSSMARTFVRHLRAILQLRLGMSYLVSVFHDDRDR